MIDGADVSGWQGPNWQPADDDAFVFVKSTEGSAYFSADSVEQLHAARAKGLQIGHYHFMVPGNAARQAAWFVASTDIQVGDILVCDWETHREGHPSVADAAEFIAEVKRLKPAHRVGLYCNKSDWLNTAVKAGDFLWIAQWDVDEPSIASTWHFHQYTKYPLDRNHGHFDSADSLKAWARGTNYSVKYQSLYVPFNSGTSRWITPIDRTIVIACARASGWGTVRLSQGGLSTSVTDSAMTHAGLGVADIAIDGRTKDQVWKLCAALIRSGIVAFPRGYGGDPWADEQHIHFVSVESEEHVHQQARDQLGDYYDGGDGLRGDGAYNGPSTKFDRWVKSPYNPVNIKADTSTYVTTSVLNARDVDGNITRTRNPGYEVQAVKQVNRWDRWNVVTSSERYYALQYLKKVA